MNLASVKLFGVLHVPKDPVCFKLFTLAPPICGYLIILGVNTPVKLTTFPFEIFIFVFFFGFCEVLGTDTFLLVATLLLTLFF